MAKLTSEQRSVPGSLPKTRDRATLTGMCTPKAARPGSGGQESIFGRTAQPNLVLRLAAATLSLAGVRSNMVT